MWQPEGHEKLDGMVYIYKSKNDMWKYFRYTSMERDAYIHNGITGS